MTATSMSTSPYHHLENGTYRNSEDSPTRTRKAKWSYWTFYKEKKKVSLKIPPSHVIPKETVKQNLLENQNNDYVMWIGHATFLIKIGNQTIITDPFFSQNAGPFNLGPRRYVDPALPLSDLPKIDNLLLTHNHYDHLDLNTLRTFPNKNANVVVPLGLSKYFMKYQFKNITELDWEESITINKELKITLLPAVHWSKRTLTDTNKTLWGSFLIEYRGKKIFFACDTGYGDLYKRLGNKYGPIDITFINIGAYDFKPMFEKSIFHTTPEEALMIAKHLGSKKIIGMHWGTILLSLEPILEPPKRLKKSALIYGFDEKDAIVFSIGQLTPMSQLLKP